LIGPNFGTYSARLASPPSPRTGRSRTCQRVHRAPGSARRRHAHRRWVPAPSLRSVSSLRRELAGRVLRSTASTRRGGLPLPCEWPCRRAAPACGGPAV